MQVCAALFAAAVLLLVGSKDAWSGLLAGAVSVLPNALFAWLTERQRSPGRLVAFGVLRFVLTILLLAAAVAALRPAPLGFFGTFMLVQLAFVAGPLMDRDST